MADNSATSAILAIVILLLCLAGFAYFYTGGTFNFTKGESTTVVVTPPAPSAPAAHTAPSTPAK